MSSHPARNEAAAGERHAWYAVVLLSIASMVGYLDRSLLTLMVAPVRADLDLSGTQMSLLLGFAFAVFMGVASLPLAWLADRFDRSRLLAAGILTWSLMTALGAYAESFGMLFLSRVGVGIGEAVLVPVGAALIADLFPREKLGRANSVVTIGTGIGAGLSLVVGGAVIHWVTEEGVRTIGFLEGFRGWQAGLLLAALPGLPLALLFLLTVRDPRNSQRNRSLIVPNPQSDPSWRLFVTENRRTLITLWLAYPLLSVSTSGWLAWSPTLLMQKFGMDPAMAGRHLGLLILTCGLLGALLGGIVTDRFFRRGGSDAAIRMSIWACPVLAVCGGLAPGTDSLPLALGLLGIYFFCINVMTIMPLLAMQLITPPPLRARMIAGLLIATTLIGGGLGPTAVAVVSESVFGSMAALDRSLALVSVVLCPSTAIMLLLARRPFARSLAARAAADEVVRS